MGWTLNKRSCCYHRIEIYVRYVAATEEPRSISGSHLMLGSNARWLPDIASLRVHCVGGPDHFPPVSPLCPPLCRQPRKDPDWLLRIAVISVVVPCKSESYDYATQMRSKEFWWIRCRSSQSFRTLVLSTKVFVHNSTSIHANRTHVLVQHLLSSNRFGFDCSHKHHVWSHSTPMLACSDRA